MSISTSTSLFFTILVCLGLIACNDENKIDLKANKVATVFDHNLYFGEVPEDFTNTSSPYDSAALVNAFVDQWIRKMLLLHEAEKRKPESLNIDKLVADYKQSLLINNLEKQVISEELDTVIKTNELKDMYDKMKDNFIQEFPIIRLSYIKIPEKTPQIDKFYEWWKEGNHSRIKYYTEKHRINSFIDHNSWREWNEVKNMIDESILKRYSLTKPKTIQKNIGEYEYFIKIYEFADKNEVSPLSYIEDQIKNIIIQKRKTSVMDVYLERIYQNELKKKNIVLHNENTN